ncbi:putative transcriptional regulator [Rubidibacter lacunae KORDI 51-2]|uniref:Putative transcriptional regulator n=2 Tax=Rubidibacter TaxID=582491 RepID=U5DJI4_9CHRO|nr:putative transcriptional regulator [Rubidibacter lacunae KORDI 51-2]
MFAVADDLCEIAHATDPASLRDWGERVLPLEKAQRMAEVFKVLADANRLRRLAARAEREESACDLAAIAALNESAVSHQVLMPRAMRLVRYRKQGGKIYCTLDDCQVLDLYRAAAYYFNEPGAL